jgi:hypothetical protein
MYYMYYEKAMIWLRNRFYLACKLETEMQPVSKITQVSIV